MRLAWHCERECHRDLCGVGNRNGGRSVHQDAPAILREGGQSSIHFLGQLKGLIDDDQCSHVARAASGDLVLGDEARRVAEASQCHQRVVGSITEPHDDVLATVLGFRPENADAMSSPRLDRERGETIEELAPGHQVGLARLALDLLPARLLVHPAEDVAKALVSEPDPADAEGQPVSGDSHELAGNSRTTVRTAQSVADPSGLSAALHFQQSIHQQPLIQVVGTADLIVPSALVLEVERRVGRREVLALTNGGMIGLHAAAVPQCRIDGAQVLGHRAVGFLIEPHEVARPRVEPFLKQHSLGLGHRLGVSSDLFDPELGGQIDRRREFRPADRK